MPDPDIVPPLKTAYLSTLVSWLAFGTKLSFMRVPRLLFTGFLFLLLSLLARPVKATHLMGNDITYTCVNQCTIEVHQRVYRDCCSTCSQWVGLQNFEINGANGCPGQPTQIGGWQPGNDPSQSTGWIATEVTPVCPGTVTQCVDPQNSQVRGVQEYHRWSQWDICGTGCAAFTIEWWGQNRNGGITSGAANQGLGSFLTTINTSLGACNSSPQFNNPPVPYLCAGQPFTFNQGATDPDGDSLSYQLGLCYTDNNVPINYNAGYSFSAPLGPSWITSINPATGDVTFTPNPGNVEVGVMCVYVQEWRNGVLINTIVRDMQLNVIPCPNNTVPVANTVTNVINGTGSGNGGTGITVGTCINNNLCFDIPLTDADVADSIYAWWNNAIPGGQFFLSGNPGIQDTIGGVNPVATFCWTPTSAGTFSFIVEMRDNNCPLYGFSQFTVTINVSNPTALAAVQNVECDTATICAFGLNGALPYTYNWGGRRAQREHRLCDAYLSGLRHLYLYSDGDGCLWLSSDIQRQCEHPQRADGGRRARYHCLSSLQRLDRGTRATGAYLYLGSIHWIGGTDRSEPAVDPDQSRPYSADLSVRGHHDFEHDRLF